jgi:hypothetical protein
MKGMHMSLLKAKVEQDPVSRFFERALPSLVSRAQQTRDILANEIFNAGGLDAIRAGATTTADREALDALLASVDSHATAASVVADKPVVTLAEAVAVKVASAARIAVNQAAARDAAAKVAARAAD